MSNKDDKTKSTPQKMVSLFAGIGGFELGFKKAGIETSLVCEIDPTRFKNKYDKRNYR